MTRLNTLADLSTQGFLTDEEFQAPEEGLDPSHAGGILGRRQPGFGALAMLSTDRRTSLGWSQVGLAPILNTHFGVCRIALGPKSPREALGPGRREEQPTHQSRKRYRGTGDPRMVDGDHQAF